MPQHVKIIPFELNGHSIFKYEKIEPNATTHTKLKAEIRFIVGLLQSNLQIIHQIIIIEADFVFK